MTSMNSWKTLSGTWKGNVEIVVHMSATACGLLHASHSFTFGYISTHIQAYIAITRIRTLDKPTRIAEKLKWWNWILIHLPWRRMYWWFSCNYWVVYRYRYAAPPNVFVGKSHWYELNTIRRMRPTGNYLAFDDRPFGTWQGRVRSRT